MKKNAALVLLGLGLGCGAGAAATHHATAQGYPPPAPGYAPPAAAPVAGPRWQQFCEQTNSVQEASNVAGARGTEGFELVAVYNGVLCFKRPVMAGGAPMPAPSVPSGFPGY